MRRPVSCLPQQEGQSTSQRPQWEPQILGGTLECHPQGEGWAEVHPSFQERRLHLESTQFLCELKWSSLVWPPNDCRRKSSLEVIISHRASNYLLDFLSSRPGTLSEVSTHGKTWGPTANRGKINSRNRPTKDSDAGCVSSITNNSHVVTFKNLRNQVEKFSRKLEIKTKDLMEFLELESTDPSVVVWWLNCKLDAA